MIPFQFMVARVLRDEAAKVVDGHRGRLMISSMVGDVRRMHDDPNNHNALFQVASQFNLLEMTGPDVTPENGVTRYVHDRTQGPACALAAGAATVSATTSCRWTGSPGKRENVESTA
jgi:hypothetical protein